MNKKVNTNFVKEHSKGKIDVMPFRGQFHQHLTRAFFVRIFCQRQNVTRKSLQKGRSYEKSEQKTLMKLTLDLLLTCSDQLQTLFSASFISKENLLRVSVFSYAGKTNVRQSLLCWVNIQKLL